VVHLGFALVLVFMTSKGKKESGLWRQLGNILFIFVVVVAAIYLIREHPALVRGRDLNGWDVAIGAAFTLVLVEAARRTMGLALPILAAIAVAYSYLGPIMPELFAHKGYSTERLIGYLFLTSDGIFGVALGTSATYIAALVLFAAFLDSSGAGALFINLAHGMFGRSKGGPATVAVVASGFIGSISGSAAGNVVTTGTFTIPLMRSVGYKSYFAGAVEAVASTGGMIMPPIMGAGAFLMADYLGVPYATIITAALVPALLYFASVLMLVRLQAEKMNLSVIADENIPRVAGVLRRGWHLLLPLIILIVLIMAVRMSPILAAMYSIASILTITLVTKGPVAAGKVLWSGLEKGSRAVVIVAIACAVAGILVGVFMLTGLGFRLSEIIVHLAGGQLFVLLLFTMIASLILGMGVPATPAYIIIAALAVPALVDLGVMPLSAHLFAFYFGVLSNITPPIAIAAFAAAGLTGDSPLKVGVTAARLGVVSYLVPFLFVYNPALLMQGPLPEALVAAVTALAGVGGFAAGYAGWLRGPLRPWVRVVLIAGGLCMIVPGLISDAIGVITIAAVVVLRYGRERVETLGEVDLAEE